MNAHKKTVGTYIEVNPEGFEGWDRVELFLKELSLNFRFKDEDVEFKIIYKDEDFGHPPTLGVKIKYNALGDPEYPSSSAPFGNLT